MQKFFSMFSNYLEAMSNKFACLQIPTESCTTTERYRTQIKSCHRKSWHRSFKDLFKYQETTEIVRF